MKRVRMALIASGGGTDAFAVMSNRKQIPEIDLKLLISTDKNAGCLEKARQCNVPSLIIDRKDAVSAAIFNRALTAILINKKIQLVFLVGCIVKIPAIENVSFYNIHPADLEKCGGRGMYGLEPHKKVLLDIQDLIKRGRKTTADRFYTEPTVHEVGREYDSGEYLLKFNLEIPGKIITDFLEDPTRIEEAAKRLQQYVLPYEWKILPLAVRIAAAKILDK